MPETEIWPALLGPLVTAYAPVLASPGPNLLVVVRASVAAPGRGPLVAALGVACGAALAASFAGLGASLLPAGRLVTGLGTALFAFLMLRAALRLISGRAGRPDDPARLAPGRDAGTFALGLGAALTNPVSLAFFTGFFLAHPDRAALPLAGAAVFCMAALWFGLVGLVLARPACRARLAGTGRLARHVLAASLVACAALAVWRAVQA
ncbi:MULTISPECIES: LysE family transporter [Methylobacterium]|uniref:LysE family transporter n=1 Tax=Methylobacterium TaxID=407 RepID=UPI0013EBAAB4|nr:LysE family transporter [Methylobacterium sp. DB0501]NGM37481.1 LysE family transporter [Methylobacterium sp. DB0501]